MKEKLFCGACKKVGKAIPVKEFVKYKCEHCGVVNEVSNIPIKEWVGFNYQDYLDAIKAFIKNDDFSLLAAKSPEELKIGKLSKIKINRLKTVLSDAMDEGKTLQEIAQTINDKVKPGKRFRMKGDEKILVSQGMKRSLSIARTEVTRVSNAGALKHYAEGGVKEYRWVATMSDRTCPICEDLNGKVFKTASGMLPPAHALCRCTIVPVTELG